MAPQLVITMPLATLPGGGSPRRGGNSEVMLKIFVEALAVRGERAAVVQFRDCQFTACIGCKRVRPAAARPLLAGSA